MMIAMQILVSFEHQVTELSCHKIELAYCLDTAKSQQILCPVAKYLNPPHTFVCLTADYLGDHHHGTGGGEKIFEMNIFFPGDPFRIFIFS